MPRSNARAWTDAELLDVLERARSGESATMTGKRYGVSRAAILGIRHRCRSECELQIGDALDGTMPSGWWKIGLQARMARAA